MGWVALPADRQPTNSNLAAPPGLGGPGYPCQRFLRESEGPATPSAPAGASFQASRLSAWGSCGHGLGHPDAHPVGTGTATKCTRAPGRLAELPAEPQGAHGICGCLTKGPGPSPESREQAPLGRHLQPRGEACGAASRRCSPGCCWPGAQARESSWHFRGHRAALGPQAHHARRTPAGARAGHAARDLARTPSPRMGGRVLHAGPRLLRVPRRSLVRGLVRCRTPPQVVQIWLPTAPPSSTGEGPRDWLLEAGAHADRMHTQRTARCSCAAQRPSATADPWPGRWERNRPASSLPHQARGGGAALLTPTEDHRA